MLVRKKSERRVHALIRCERGSERRMNTRVVEQRVETRPRATTFRCRLTSGRADGGDPAASPWQPADGGMGGPGRVAMATGGRRRRRRHLLSALASLADSAPFPGSWPITEFCLFLFSYRVAHGRQRETPAILSRVLMRSFKRIAGIVELDT